MQQKTTKHKDDVYVLSTVYFGFTREESSELFVRWSLFGLTGCAPDNFCNFPTIWHSACDYSAVQRWGYPHTDMTSLPPPFWRLACPFAFGFPSRSDNTLCELALIEHNSTFVNFPTFDSEHKRPLPWTSLWDPSGPVSHTVRPDGAKNTRPFRDSSSQQTWVIIGVTAWQSSGLEGAQTTLYALSLLCCL